MAAPSLLFRIAGLDEFPESLYYLRHPVTLKIGAFHVDDGTQDRPLDGLAVFGSQEAAGSALRRHPSWTGMVPRNSTFDSAREVAIAKGLEALVLLDDPSTPKVHWVR